MVFGGNMNNWMKFANTLKLKIYLRQTEGRPAVASAGVTSLLGESFLDVDAALTGFTDAPNISNQPTAIGERLFFAHTAAFRNSSSSVFIISQLAPNTQYKAGRQSAIRIENTMFS